MNVPTILTFLRILLVPVFMVLLLFNIPGGNLWAAGVFIIAALTDLLDGHIARNWHLVTKFGKLIDPIADKLLVSAALISLVELGRVSAWAATLIIGREFAVSGLRLLAASEGVVISASSSGKWKTALQMIAILTALLNLPGATVLIWLSVVITFYSGMEYFAKGQRFLRTD